MMCDLKSKYPHNGCKIEENTLAYKMKLAGCQKTDFHTNKF